jgi:hypothetical protein
MTERAHRQEPFLLEQDEAGQRLEQQRGGRSKREHGERLRVQSLTQKQVQQELASARGHREFS